MDSLRAHPLDHYAVLVAAYMLAFFHRFAPAMVSAELSQAFGITAAALGSLAAMYFYIYTAMQIPGGRAGRHARLALRGDARQHRRRRRLRLFGLARASRCQHRPLPRRDSASRWCSSA
jgi:hypothetical protein